MVRFTPVSGRLRALTRAICLLLCCAFVLATTNASSRPRVQVLMGVPDELQAETLSAVQAELQERYTLEMYALGTSATGDTTLFDGQGEQVTLGDESPESSQSMVEAIIGVGRQGCEMAARSSEACPVLCVLLSSAAFSQLKAELAHPNLHAIVVDQPESRQARIASSIYPELKRFTILSNLANEKTDSPAIEHIPFDDDKAIAGQVTSALLGRDALIATPEHEIFNRSTLRTVLLTAYGYAKPVIGYSKAYVKAGALISSYSSSSHAFKQVVEVLPELLEPGYESAVDVLEPRYFSITDNPSVARSLGLIKRRSFAMDQSYSDEDFAS